MEDFNLEFLTFRKIIHNSYKFKNLDELSLFSKNYKLQKSSPKPEMY